MYRVFLGAPSKADIFNDANSYKWHTISSSDSYSKSTRLGVEFTQSFIFPLATLEAASQKISLIYKNIIFDDVSELEGLSEEQLEVVEPTREGLGMVLSLATRLSLMRLFRSRTDHFDNVAPYGHRRDERCEQKRRCHWTEFSVRQIFF